MGDESVAISLRIMLMETSFILLPRNPVRVARGVVSPSAMEDSLMGELISILVCSPRTGDEDWYIKGDDDGTSFSF